MDDEKILLVYAGRRLDAITSKLMYEWIDIDSQNHLGRARRWHKQIEINAHVGNIFQFAGTRLENGGLELFARTKRNVAFTEGHAPVFVAGYPRKEDYQQWGIEDAAAYRARQTIESNMKARTPAPPLDALKPFKRAYRDASPMRRAALITMIVEYIIRS